jgi:Flp pilus assembly protein CpaB
MKQSTIITLVVVLAVIGIAAYLYKQNKDKKAAAVTATKPNVAITVNRGGVGIPVNTATVSLNTGAITAPVA